MAKTVYQKNREAKQNSLREFLSNQKLIEKVLDSSQKIDQLAWAGIDYQIEANETDDKEEKMRLLALAKEEVFIAKERAAMLAKGSAGRVSMINKYLPDLKTQDIIIETDENKAGQLAIISSDPIEASREYTMIMAYDAGSSH